MNHPQGHKANDVFAPEGAWQSDVSASKKCLEYDAFGSLLPGRNYSSGSYRYLFQGQEHDDELNGSVGTSYAFEYRMHDPRIGRFLSLDPLASKYPHNSPYAFCENKVIRFIELEGLECFDQFGDGTNDPGCAEDREAFEKFPKAEQSSNPSHRRELRAGSHIDDQGNFFMKADSYDELLHASVIGAEVAVLEGDMVEPLKTTIHGFDATENSNFYQDLVSEFKGSGKTHLSVQRTVTFGPVDRLEAYSNASTYIMRNAQAKIWVSYNADGNVQIDLNVYDFFNVVPQGDKGSTYNKIASGLDPAHRATGANVNMQTRASWSVTTP